ncbi:response regulator transcription factor [Actinoplanes sp. M2I2]|uniref:helix-turn-helix transcriptional regulator n=1 Tax=Actinoplanes sp. M2I2 TaxID=1734444 RepID=UPI0020224F04|nr:response regulator transcription factor [Actinoplanes sp. M2I2]
MERLRVAVQSTDPLSHAGLVRFLEAGPEVVVIMGDSADLAQVLVMGADRLTVEAVARLRRSADETGLPVVLVVGELRETELLLAVECRVVAILPRRTVTADLLVSSVKTAVAGGGVMPPNLVGELLRQTERLQREVLAPNGLSLSGLTSREIDVLRLVADGYDTAEVARELNYSERTVKKVLYGMTCRLELRNRPQAVAYAVRAGLI